MLSKVQLLWRCKKRKPSGFFFTNVVWGENLPHLISWTAHSSQRRCQQTSERVSLLETLWVPRRESATGSEIPYFLPQMFSPWRFRDEAAWWGEMEATVFLTNQCGNALNRAGLKRNVRKQEVSSCHPDDLLSNTKKQRICHINIVLFVCFVPLILTYPCLCCPSEAITAISAGVTCFSNLRSKVSGCSSAFVELPHSHFDDMSMFFVPSCWFVFHLQRACLLLCVGVALVISGFIKVPPAEDQSAYSLLTGSGGKNNRSSPLHQWRVTFASIFRPRYVIRCK